MSIYDKIVIYNSHVSENAVDEESKNKLMAELPRADLRYARCDAHPISEKEYITSPKLRQINNGKDVYKVSDSLYFFHYGHDGYRTAHDEFSAYHEARLSRRISVMYEDCICSLYIEKASLDYKPGGYGCNKENLDKEKAYIRFKGEWDGIDCDIKDMEDINAIRYACRDDKRISYFLDKFVIVSPKEREAYRRYERAKKKENISHIKEKHREEMMSKNIRPSERRFYGTSR